MHPPRAREDAEGDGVSCGRVKTPEEAVLDLERTAAANALRADGRFNFKTLKRDLALEGLDNLCRSYSPLSMGSSIRLHAQRAVNIRRSKSQPTIGPSLLHHGIAIRDEEEPVAEAVATQPRDGFASGYNRYLLATQAIGAGQGFGSEFSQRARSIHGHMHSLDCIVPLLPPAHATAVSRSLNEVRFHLFAAGEFREECEAQGSDARIPRLL
jgi:hypothetical protein